MAQAAYIRRNSRKAQTCLAVFLVALINLTMQPCVMAMEAMSSIKAPVQSEHCMHHGHHMTAQDIAQDGSCASTAAFMTDARSTSPDLIKIGDYGTLVAILPTVVVFPDSDASIAVEHSQYQISWQGSPPLRALYCTYLI